MAVVYYDKRTVYGSLNLLRVRFPCPVPIQCADHARLHADLVVLHINIAIIDRNQQKFPPMYFRQYLFLWEKNHLGTN